MTKSTLIQIGVGTFIILGFCALMNELMFGKVWPL